MRLRRCQCGYGCWVGRRTRQVLDFGKMAATFVDTHTDHAVRIIPHPEVRQAASHYAPQAKDHWHAYLEAYQVIPLAELLVAEPVSLMVSMRVHFVIGVARRSLTSVKCAQKTWFCVELVPGSHISSCRWRFLYLRK